MDRQKVSTVTEYHGEHGCCTKCCIDDQHATLFYQYLRTLDWVSHQIQIQTIGQRQSAVSSVFQFADTPFLPLYTVTCIMYIQYINRYQYDIGKNVLFECHLRELSFITGRGGRLSVMAGRQFFLVPPLAYDKKFWSPPLPTGKKFGPPFGLGKKFWSPPSW